MTDAHEASMNFDIEAMPPFLARIAGLLDDGFGNQEIETLVELAWQMDVDTEQTREFRVTYRGNSVPLRVQIVLDDIDAPDLYFFTSAELAAAIQREMSAFADEMGL